MRVVSTRDAYTRGRAGAAANARGARQATADRERLDDSRFKLEFRLFDLNLDVPPPEIPVEMDRRGTRFVTAWSHALNARARDTARERMAGWKATHTTGWTNLMAGRSISFVPDQAQPYWCVWAPTALYVTDGGAWFLAMNEGAPGLSETYWLQLENNTVLGGPSAGPYYIDWLAGSPFTPAILPGWPETGGVPDWYCRTIASSNNFLVAGGMNESSQWLEDKIRWSDPSAAGTIPQNWIPAANNLAGDAVIAGNGPIRAMLPMAGALFAYREQETWIGTYVGPPYVWDWRRRFKTRGAMGQKAVVEIAGRHFCVSDRDFGYHDGVNWTSLSTRRVRRWLHNRHADLWPARGNGQLAYVSGKRELWYLLPDQDGIAREVLIYSLDENTFTTRSLFYPSEAMDVGSVAEPLRPTTWNDPEAWADDLTSWANADITYTDVPVFTNSTRTTGAQSEVQQQLRAYEIDTEEEEGEQVRWRLERTGLDFGAPMRVDTLHEVWPRVTEYGPCWIDVHVGSQMTERDPVAWFPPKRINSPDEKVTWDPGPSGRLLSIAFSSSCKALPRIEGFDVVFSRDGPY